MSINFICKLCRLPGTCELNPDQEKAMLTLGQEDRDRLESFVPALCHHGCWEIWWECSQVEMTIHRAASVIAADETGKVREFLVPRMEKLVNRWVANEYRRFREKSRKVSNKMLLDSIISRPLATPKILSDTRSMIGKP